MEVKLIQTVKKHSEGSMNASGARGICAASISLFAFETIAETSGTGVESLCGRPRRASCGPRPHAFRRLVMRHENKLQLDQAFVHVACMLIALGQF